MHAGIPAYCLGDYFRLLLDRRRQDPGMDAESFLSWATSPGRELRLSVLDMPARRFLVQGGDYAHDVVDRSLDLLERFSEPDPILTAYGFRRTWSKALVMKLTRVGWISRPLGICTP